MRTFRARQGQSRLPLFKRGGQVTLEYTTVIACVVAALLTAGVYFQRAYQGRMRNTADQLGGQYEPGATTANMTTAVVRDIHTVISKDQEPDTLIDGRPGYGTWEWETTNTDETRRQGTETVGP
ncbi:hypothetical protein ACFL2I_03330 [Candidatus Omnitrophota bacterium]